MTGFGYNTLGFGVGKAFPPVVVSNTDSAHSSSNLSTYTFSSMSLGAADTDRVIVVGLGTQGATVFTADVTNITVGGTGLTERLQTNGAASG